MTALPNRIADVEELDLLLSEPPAYVVEALRGLEGDLLVLGVGGKMGPTLARMAVRASAAAGRRRRVIGVARFSESGLEDRLRAWGVDTIRGDLLDRGTLAKLPDAPLVVSMAARKFGSSTDAGLTWAMNVYQHALVMERFAGSRVVAFSTGNVYPLVPIGSGGSCEEQPLGPVGEYAQSALGRERIYEYFSRLHGTPTALIRLNYACELRYGVLVDIATKVARGEPLDVTMGHVNVIWQGDANAMSLAALAEAQSPPWLLNVAGPETLSVRQVAEEFGRLLDRAPVLSGAEADSALLSNGRRGHQRFGYPSVPVGQLIAWIADWVARGGPTLSKPTHFETRDGQF